MKTFTSEVERSHWLSLHGAMLTGSVAYGVDGPGSDIDWLLDHDTGILLCGEDMKRQDEASGDGLFHSVRDGKHNYIIAVDDDFYCRWLVAHAHCMFERPKEKDRRIAIFRYHLYREGGGRI